MTEQIQELKRHNPATLPDKRYERFRKLGSWLETAPQIGETGAGLAANAMGT